MLRNPSSSRLKENLAERARKRRRRQDRAYGAQQRTTDSPRRNDLRPRLTLSELPLDAVRPPARAVRRLEPEHITQIAASIAALGLCEPILVNAEGQILNGVARWAAAKQLGLSTIPCVVLDHLTPAEERLARLAFNRLAERGSWDVQALRLEIEELIELDAPIEIAGFETAELDMILAADEPPYPPDDEERESSARTAVSRLGDAWELGAHRVLCGDATSADAHASLIGAECPRLVLTDPPYNVPILGFVSGGKKRRHREFVSASGEMSAAAFRDFLVRAVGLAAERLVDGGLLFSFIDWRHVADLIDAAECNDLQYLNLAVWAKTGSGMGSLYRSRHELVGIFKRGKAPHVNNVQLGRHGRDRSNLWTYAGASTFGSDARQGLGDHPTPKPVAMLEDAIIDVTEPGDLVLDPFLGSGSTLIAAHRTHRRCYGLELDPLYVDVILRRWIKETGELPRMAGTGQTYSDVAERRAAEPHTLPSPLLSLPAPSASRADGR